MTALVRAVLFLLGGGTTAGALNAVAAVPLGIALAVGAVVGILCAWLGIIAITVWWEP